MKAMEILNLQNSIQHQYEQYCMPIAQKYGMPLTSFDIIMFLGNNPSYVSAADIVSRRKIKANLVSYHVEKLVKEGYLERRASKNDRRTIALFLTDKAQPVLKDGRVRQKQFFKILIDGVPESMIESIEKCLIQMEDNVKTALDEKGKQK
jgi:MarR family transcriptional regulator for hemolysin